MSDLTLDELKENFSLFDDWEERYRYLIDLGRTLPPMDDALKTENYIVKGCTSRVWLVAQIEQGVLTFTADSDAHIVRGLIAFLYIAYNNKSVEDIKKINIHEVFDEIGLSQNLSPNRRNGFYSMVERILSYAA